MVCTLRAIILRVIGNRNRGCVTSTMAYSDRAVLDHSESVFVSQYNAATGCNEWVKHDVDYDFAQETARSGYADMLHDHERNVLYENGLKSVIEHMKQQGKQVHVLDIGAGTGLLSLMAARAGADRVSAIEVFAPMAKVAHKVIRKNGYDHTITLHNKRSTDIESGELSDKPNVCVAEVFDTELIGEGALRVFKEAVSNLMQPNSRVVPSSARVWVQPIQSPYVSNWKQLNNMVHDDYGIHIIVPETIAKCSGAPSVHDLQLNQLHTELFRPVGEPILIERFDFEHPSTYDYHNCSQHPIKFNESAESLSSVNRIDAVMFWWDLDMDGTGTHVLSVQPDWIRADTNWRDHWMQAIYYLPQPFQLSPDSRPHLLAYHDEYNWWFDVSKTSNNEIANQATCLEPPACTCMMHVMCSRNNMARINDHSIRSIYIEAIKKSLTSTSPDSVVCLGDLCLLSLAVGQMHSQLDGTAVERNARARRLLDSFVNANNLTERVKTVDDVDHLQLHDATKILVVGEPFYFVSSQPWHDLSQYWLSLQDVRRISGAQVMSVPKESIDRADTAVEPFSVWEYPSRAVSRPHKLIQFDFEKSPTDYGDLHENVEVDIDRTIGCNACVLWVDWHLNDDLTVSRGLTSSCAIGDTPKWYAFSQQGVHFIRATTDTTRLNVHVAFDANTADVNVIVKCAN